MADELIERLEKARRYDLCWTDFDGRDVPGVENVDRALADAIVALRAQPTSPSEDRIPSPDPRKQDGTALARAEFALSVISGLNSSVSGTREQARTAIETAQIYFSDTSATSKQDVSVHVEVSDVIDKLLDPKPERFSSPEPATALSAEVVEERQRLLKSLKHCFEKPMRNIETFPAICRLAYDALTASNDDPRVKALEWQQQEAPTNDIHEATTPFGSYRVWGFSVYWHWDFNSCSTSIPLNTRASAKDAAQADYATRVLAALEASP